MMASIFFVGVSKVSPARCLIRLCKTSKSHNVTQMAFLTRLAYQEQSRKKPSPFPYWKKKYNLFHRVFDPMTFRFDESTKVVVVDGLPAIGKSKFCEKIADEFGLLYMPAPTHDELYINTYGFDIRELDPQLPFYCRSFDVPRFLENPNDKRAAFFQMLYFQMRFEQYINALLHLLSTGQGIVLNRCVYSDIVFVEAMKNSGYLSNPVVKSYMHMRQIGLSYLLRPHLVIYLDVPVELVKDKIRQRGRPYEVNSKVFSTKYLTDLENAYKEKYLKVLSDHTHLLVYDWSNEGDLTSVVEDIEKLDLEDYCDGRLEDWVFDATEDLCDLRSLYAHCQHKFFINMYHSDSPDWPRELRWTHEEVSKMDTVLDNCMSEKYDPGYNVELGDKVLWKSVEEEPFRLRRTPRDFVNRTKYMS